MGLPNIFLGIWRVQFELKKLGIWRFEDLDLEMEC